MSESDYNNKVKAINELYSFTVLADFQKTELLNLIEEVNLYEDEHLTDIS